MKYIIITILIGIGAGEVWGQEWTIVQCIDTALIRNVGTLQSKLDLQVAGERLTSRKYDFMPSINGAATHGYNWGQSIDPFTNQFASERVQTNNFYLYGNLVLFSGLQKYYGFQIESINQQTAQYNHEVVCRNLKIEISAAYLQVLLNDELLNVARDHLVLTLKQKERITKLIRAGQDTESKLNDVLVQEAQDQYMIIKAQNDLNYALLFLQQLVNIPYQDSFNIKKLTDEEDQIFINEAIDVQSLPEIKKVNLEIEKQSMEVKSAKGNLYPSIALTGSMGSGYSGNNTYENSNGELLPKRFEDQLSENFYQQVYLSLNIPIFNQNNSRSKAKIEAIKLKQAELEKAQQILEITNAIEKVKLDISNYQSQYESALTLFEAAKFSFDQATIKFENEVITFTDLIEKKNLLFKAQSEVFQSKYQMIISQMVLKYYAA